MRPSPDELAAIPLFESLSEDERDAVANLLELRSEAEGTEIVTKGDRGAALFVIREGTVAVSRDGAQVATLEAGDFFGEFAVMVEGQRNATVTATSDVTLLVMYRADFDVFVRDMPGAAAVLRETVERRRPEG
jgi:voltage-gated potassium channel